MSKSEKQKSVPASSIKSLGGASPVFDLPVIIQRAGQDDLEVVLKVKAMRKSEWAAIRDSHMEKGQELAEGAATGKFTHVDFFLKGAKETSGLVLDVAVGWQFDEELNQDTLVELEDMVPGSIQAFVTRIDAALFHGRVKN